MLPLIIVQYCAILSNIVKHRFHVWLPMFGITAASQNIKQDLVAVRQKKLDDKVVEVISTMIQSQTLFFFQKPATEPDKVLQFTVPLSTIHYLQAISDCLCQNLLRIPLIAPDYMTWTWTWGTPFRPRTRAHGAHTVQVGTTSTSSARRTGQTARYFPFSATNIFTLIQIFSVHG